MKTLLILFLLALTSAALAQNWQNDFYRQQMLMEQQQQNFTQRQMLQQMEQQTYYQREQYQRTVPNYQHPFGAFMDGFERGQRMGR